MLKPVPPEAIDPMAKTKQRLPRPDKEAAVTMVATLTADEARKIEDLAHQSRVTTTSFLRAVLVEAGNSPRPEAWAKVVAKLAKGVKGAMSKRTGRPPNDAEPAGGAK